MPVLLEVVGLYFATVVETSPQQTVLDIVKTAAKDNPDFNYKTEQSRDSMKWMEHTVQKEIDSRTGKKRQPGVYFIGDEINDKEVTAWQYYIERPRGGYGMVDYQKALKDGDAGAAQQARKNVHFERISLTLPSDGGFKGPSASEPVRDGDTIIWRCVRILRGPNRENSIASEQAIN